ncbi:MAG: hypothetical protein HY673_09315, partial [Chloroflexi bacterium]|nr:hypothetical protein [Chloroflexota bacterium]
ASHIVPYRSCQFWGIKEECKFCDINENARQVKKFKVNTLKAAHLKVDQVATVANEIAQDVVERESHPLTTNWMISGGTITSKLDGLTEDEFYLRYVEAVKWGGPRRWVMLAVSAKDKATFREYHYRGVDRPLCNLEVWDKHLFEWICPGKAERVGWEEWVKRLVDAVDIFGEFNVQCQFVGGIELARPYGFKTVAEAVKSTAEGIKFLMSRGVSPAIGAWSREPGSYLERVQKQALVVPLEYYLQLLRIHYENYKRYKMTLPRRAGQSPELKVIAYHNITQDMVILKEEKDYEEQALRALEQIGAIWSYAPQAA